MHQHTRQQLPNMNYINKEVTSAEFRQILIESEWGSKFSEAAMYYIYRWFLADQHRCTGDIKRNLILTSDVLFLATRGCEEFEESKAPDWVKNLWQFDRVSAGGIPLVDKYTFQGKNYILVY